MNSYNFVLYRVDDSNVAAQCGNENAISRRNEHGPEWPPRYPEATHELIIDAVTWQAGQVDIDTMEYYREGRRTHVYGALVHD